jgi:hypothetical protein
MSQKEIEVIVARQLASYLAMLISIGDNRNVDPQALSTKEVKLCPTSAMREEKTWHQPLILLWTK